VARCRHRMLSLGPRRREEQRLPVDRVGNRPTRIASGRGAVENCLSPRSKDRLAPLPSSTSATAQAISPSAPGRSGSRTRLTTPSRRSTRRRTSPRPSDPGWRWADVRGRGPRVGLGRERTRRHAQPHRPDDEHRAQLRDRQPAVATHQWLRLDVISHASHRAARVLLLGLLAIGLAVSWT